MKLSVFTVATPDLEPEALIAAAKEAGLDGIEWRYRTTPPERRNETPSFWGNNRCTLDPETLTPETIDALAAEVRGSGLQTAAVMPYLTVGDLEETERAMSHAARLGAKAMRVGVPSYDRSVPYGVLFEKAIVYLEQVEALSKQYGVKGLIETHHVTIAPSAGLARRLVERFDPDCIGVLFDPGNMVHEGYENFRMGLELLGPYLAHVHVKNAGWFPGEASGKPWVCRWTPMEAGIVDWKQVVADLKSVGFDGWFGLEDFSGTYDSVSMMRRYAEWLRPLANG